MLILARKLGQRIVIGQDITVEVMALTGSTVKLGIVAPDHEVWREEVHAARTQALGVTPAVAARE